jgi:hypothetical protein
VTLVAVVGVAPITIVLFGIWNGVLGVEVFDESTPALLSVFVYAVAALTGLATALAARLRRWWLLVPMATSLGAWAAVAVIEVVDPLANALAGVSIVPGAAWVAVSGGALAGVALADHLTRDRGQPGDVGEPHLTREDSPVG